MSDPVALVCMSAKGASAAPARRWRRRAQAPHSVRPCARLSASPRPPRRRGDLRGGLFVLFLTGAVWAGVTSARAHSGDSAFSRRLGAGCEELEPCLLLEADAERRVDECSLSCGRATAELATVRQMRFRAEERRAVRDHYRERERAADVERQRQRAELRDERQREREARAEEASRQRQHELELERLRQEHIERRLADERQRRMAYYAALGAKGRALRLERCLEKSRERCDALTLELLDAARDDEERRTLAETNEGVVHPAPKREPAGKSKRPPSAESAVDPNTLESGGVRDVRTIPSS